MSIVRRLQLELEETILVGTQLSCLVDLLSERLGLSEEELIEIGHSITDEQIQAKLKSYEGSPTKKRLRNEMVY